jgi:hypothetical protein
MEKEGLKRYGLSVKKTTPHLRMKLKKFFNLEVSTRPSTRVEF